MTDNYQGAFSKLDEVLGSDNEAGFVKLLQDHPNELEVNNAMVNKCVEFGAKKCLTALIRGEVCGRRPTLNAQELPTDGVTALAYVAHSCRDPEIINLMLTECGGTCLVHIGCTIGALHGLPIHFVLVDLSLLEHLYHWRRRGSLIELIFLLCRWETKPILDSLRLLAQYTDSINDIAWTMLKNGGLKQFATLLLVAREKVVAPFDTGLTIHHYITSEIDSVDEEGTLSIQQEEYKNVLMDAQKFLALFELAGDDLSSYCSSMQKQVPSEEVSRNVADFLENRLNMTDFYKTIQAYDCTDTLLGRLYNPYDKINVSRFGPYALYFDSYIASRPGRFTSLPIPKHACSGNQPRLYSTGAYQARKISPLPRHLAYFTSKVINRFKFF